MKSRDQETERLEQIKSGTEPWQKWGPYLSERQWGTVREDYSQDGNAWEYFSFDQARYRAYRWGEDGLAGISDVQQRLCFALALWNGQDPILKERLFGLSNPQGNHGEDVKDYYFYTDATPSHSYMKYVYKYPQQAFPYQELVDVNARRTKLDPEFELLDTGIFDKDRYFDVQVEYAKASPEDILIKITVVNRGREEALLHLLPTLWFRNTWSWSDQGVKPQLENIPVENGLISIHAQHLGLGSYYLSGIDAKEALFVENETNFEKLGAERQNASPYTKDSINRYIVEGESSAVNPAARGTKAAFHYKHQFQPGEGKTFNLRLRKDECVSRAALEGEHSSVFDTRIQEADEFYESVSPANLSPEEKKIFRQAIAGMLWTKQYYNYDVGKWFQEHGAGEHLRNSGWTHMANEDVISMPDKWEYPWYAVWDLAFHTGSLVLADPEFSKQQLLLFLSDRYQHNNGQVPAYEWNFGDVNPPVHAWATRVVYQTDKERSGAGDLDFLEKAFDGLVKNFEWWRTNKGTPDNNTYRGGFLGLDNIGVFDRSAELPTGGHLEQSDGTAWMALFTQNMIQLSLELAKHDPQYEDIAVGYFEEFLTVASEMDRLGEQNDEMWDDQDGFFYDVLRFPDGTATRLKVRSLVGLLPLCAVTVIEDATLRKLHKVKECYFSLVERKAILTQNIACPESPGYNGRRLLSILDEHKLRRVLSKMLDENEFLSPFGIRSLSKVHADSPYTFYWNDQSYTVAYLPGESDNRMFGGNSNWRGPVWFPPNVLIIRALLNYYAYFGDSFTMACPFGSDRNLYQIAGEISERLLRIFLPDKEGRRPVFGGAGKFQSDPHWKDNLLFYEYFHGDNGAGLGASHQTGWTGNVALLLHILRSVNPDDFLAEGINTINQAMASGK